jgi:hypothetical protein
MNTLINILRIALISQKTIAAIGASIVITAATIDYLRKRK